jgi:hypothetical protein
MTYEQMAAAAAVSGVLLWPQLRTAAGQVFGGIGKPAPAAGSRSAWVAAVLGLQDELAAAGRDKAAALAGQLVVEIVSGPAAAAAAGGKK